MEWGRGEVAGVGRDFLLGAVKAWAWLSVEQGQLDPCCLHGTKKGTQGRRWRSQEPVPGSEVP